MLETILDRHIVFVLLGILAFAGIISKCIVNVSLKRLVRAAGNMNKSNHPLMRLVRAKFEHASMISDKVENVRVFVDKYLYEYRVLGIRLHGWRRMEKISAVLCLMKLMKMSEIFDFKKEYLKLHKKYALMTIRLGLPSGLTQAIFSMAMIVVQSLTNSFGELFIAANVIVMRVDGFAMMPNFSFGTAMTTFAGQNVGAKEYRRVEQGAKQGTWIAMGVSAFITVLILIFGRYLMGIFTETEELVDLSMRMMRILAVGYIAMAVTQSLSGVMRGAGDTMTPMWISLATTVAIRVPVAYGLAYVTRSEAYPIGRCESVYISLLVSWLLGALITFICYQWGKWKGKAIGEGNWQS